MKRLVKFLVEFVLIVHTHQALKTFKNFFSESEANGAQQSGARAQLRSNGNQRSGNRNLKGRLPLR